MKKHNCLMFILFLNIFLPSLNAEIILSDHGQPLLQSLPLDCTTNAGVTRFMPPSQTLPDNDFGNNHAHVYFDMFSKYHPELDCSRTSFPLLVYPDTNNDLPKFHALPSPGANNIPVPQPALQSGSSGGKCGFRISCAPPHPGRNPTSRAEEVKHYSVNDFKEHFKGGDPNLIYYNYELYKLPNFVTYAQQIGDFDGFIVSFAQLLHESYRLRSDFRDVPGFKYSFGIRLKLSFPCFETRHKSKFLDWVFDRARTIEVNNVENVTKGIRRNHEKSLPLRTTWLEADKLYAEEYEASAEELKEERRLNALEEDFFDPCEYEQHFELNPATQQLLAAEGIDYTSFEYAQGTAVQLNIHEELIDTIHHTSCLDIAYGNNIQVSTLCKTIYHCTDVTIDLNTGFSKSSMSFDQISIMSRSSR